MISTPRCANQVLLMTSTIAPAPDTFLLARKDPAERLADYCASLRAQLNWIRKGTIDRIVYADNSGHDLAPLQAIVDEAGLTDRVEFLSFVSDVPAQFSRYYLELHLLRTAMARSHVVAQGNPLIWKLTGRYVVRNLDRIVKACPRPDGKAPDFYVNCRNHPYRTLDFYLVAFTRAGFAELLDQDLDAYRTTEAGENLLRSRLDRRDHSGLSVVGRFNRTPRLLGVRGFDGARYGDARDSAKFWARVFANRILPNLWI